MTLSTSDVPEAPDAALDGAPSLPATLTVGVGALLSAIAFSVAAFVSVTGDSAALPTWAPAGDVHASPSGADPAPALRRLAPAAAHDLDSLQDALHDLGRAIPVIRIAPDATTGPCSGGSEPVAPAPDRIRELRVNVVERATAPA